MVSSPSWFFFLEGANNNSTNKDFQFLIDLLFGDLVWLVLTCRFIIQSPNNINYKQTSYSTVWEKIPRKEMASFLLLLHVQYGYCNVIKRGT